VNLVDSSGWLEYFADGPNAGAFAAAIEDRDQLLVSAVNLYEVFKRVLQQRGEPDALNAAVQMQQAQVVPFDSTLALNAARISFDLKLPLADSVVLATARAHDALLWTQDADFKGMDKVKYVAKRT